MYPVTEQDQYERAKAELDSAIAAKKAEVQELTETLRHLPGSPAERPRRKAIHVKLPAELVKEMRAEAKREGCTLTNVVERRLSHPVPAPPVRPSPVPGRPAPEPDDEEAGP